MVFNSIDFLIFFPIVLMVYFIIPQKIRYIWLLVTSYYFYMCWNAKYALLMLFSTVATYISGLLIERIKQGRYDARKKIFLKKSVVAGCFIINLAILFWFKYVNFFIDIVVKGFSLFRIDVTPPAFDIILPVGISFYTFQALSYTMDVYRGEIYAEKNILRYALFVSFFPQLVAGPIERSKNLLTQLSVPRKVNFNDFVEGFLLILWGLFLKIVIADRTAVFVDKVYAEYNTYTGCFLIVATVLFAVQIYCDFYGYSTIAVGTAKMLGVQLMENFDAPYLSTSVAEFWRRWHISLTSWFKDYLYIPLGGSRKGKLRKYINKMIVFLVSGLWHGAQFSYVFWGGLNGFYQILGEVLMPIRKKIISRLRLNPDSIAHKLVQGIITFALVDFSWIFFRANRFMDACKIIKQIIEVHNPWILFNGDLYTCGLDQKNFTVLLIGICLLLIADSCKMKKIKIREIIMKQDAWAQVMIISCSVVGILLFGMYGVAYDGAAFIYFQF